MIGVFSVNHVIYSLIDLYYYKYIYRITIILILKGVERTLHGRLYPYCLQNNSSIIVFNHVYKFECISSLIPPHVITTQGPPQHRGDTKAKYKQK